MPERLVPVPVCLAATREGSRRRRSGGRPYDHKVDLLADALRTAGVRGAVGTRIEAGGTWGLRLDVFPGAALHALVEGSAWLTTSCQPSQHLVPGDVVLLPPGTVHRLTSDPRAAAGPCDIAAAARAREDGDVVRLGDGPVRTRVLTVHYRQDPAVRTRLLAGLPDVVHVGSGEGAGLEDVVRILGRELAERGAASSVVLDRMTDVLLVQFLREWLATRPAAGSWLAGLADPVVASALRGLHEHPEQAWTTASLAGRAAVSRATLARRFPVATGASPAAYLLRWRMDLAAARLRETDDPLHAVARAVGYTSAHAFSRAFTRERALTPGRYRTESRAQENPPDLARTA